MYVHAPNLKQTYSLRQEHKLALRIKMLPYNSLRLAMAQGVFALCRCSPYMNEIRCRVTLNRSISFHRLTQITPICFHLAQHPDEGVRSNFNHHIKMCQVSPPKIFRIWYVEKLEGQTLSTDDARKRKSCLAKRMFSTSATTHQVDDNSFLRADLDSSETEDSFEMIHSR